MKLITITAAAAACLLLGAAPVWAAPGNQGGGAGGCGVGQQTNGCASPSSSSIQSANEQSQHQDQHQGQAQGQAQTAVGIGVGLGVGVGRGGDGGASTAYGGAGGLGGAGGDGGAASAAGGSAVASGGSSDASAVSGGNSFSTVQQAQKRAPVASALAAGSAGNTCRFGPAFGVQGIALGTSLSLPVFKDRDCTTLAKAQMLLALGETEAAVQYLAARDRELNAAVSAARKR